MPDDVGLICSARRCSQTAVWGLEWNNPKLHTPDRRKVWLTCEAHRDELSSFLRARSFPVDIVPADQAQAR